MLVISRDSPYTMLPPGSRQRIDKYLSWVAENVPAYRAKVQHWHVQDGLSAFPLTYDYELADQPLDFLPSSVPAVRICSSGGTIGRPKLIMRTADDIVRSNRCTIRMFECAGISSNDRVGILQPFDLWNIGHLALMALEEIGATTCPLGFSASNDSVLSLLSELSCNALYASPSRIMQLADLCRSTGFDLSLNTILCAGEPILKHHRETAARTWGATLFGIYGSEETDGIGAECSSHAGYHVFNEDLILEVLDPATLKPGSETKGALAVTLLDYSGTALVRYVLGDLVAVDRGVCACGRSEPRVEMEGRIRETVWLFDGNKLPLASIDASLQQAFGVSPDYQLIIDHKDGTDILRFDFVAPEIPIDRAALMNVIAKSSQEMEVAFRYLHSLEIQVEVCSDRHALYTTQRGKTPRVVDRRTYVAHQQEGYGNASR